MNLFDYIVRRVISQEINRAYRRGGSALSGSAISCISVLGWMLFFLIGGAWLFYTIKKPSSPSTEPTPLVAPLESPALAAPLKMQKKKVKKKRVKKSTVKKDTIK